MKVLHIIHQISQGGATRAMMAAARYSSHLGNFHHSAASLDPSDPSALRLAQNAGMRVFDAANPGTLGKAIEEADVVFVHWWNNPRLNAWLHSELPPMRLLFWLHVGGDAAPQIITKELVDLADFLIPCSPYTYERPIFQEMPPQERSQRVEMVLAGADFERIAGVQPRHHANFNVGYIGTLDFSKMHPSYVSMNARIDIPDVRFIVCGEGNHALLHRQARELGAAERFDIRGFVHDIPSVLEILDVYGYPLCEETYAAAELNLQEAMYCGIPPVVFPYGGVKRLVSHDQTGLIVHSELEYKQAVEYLYHHPEERTRLGRNAREYARQTFGAENAARELNHIFERVSHNPKRKRTWRSKTVFPPPHLETVSRSTPSGADLFIESIAEASRDFLISITAQEKDELLAADRRIAKASPLMRSPHSGGFVHYRNTYPEDPYLRFWTGLVRQEEGNHTEALAEFAATINFGFKHWRVFRYLADAARKSGNTELAQKAAQAAAQLETQSESTPIGPPPSHSAKSQPASLSQTSPSQDRPLHPKNSGALRPSSKTKSGQRIWPKISLITPSYNQGAYLEECIDSILSQNYPHLEYIIMDGGSTDNSPQIIKKYEKHLAYWQSGPDRGQYHAVNDGFRRSTGEIMGWLNSDDKLHSGSLYMIGNIFRGFEEVEWIMGRPTGWDQQGNLRYVYGRLPTWSPQHFFSRQYGSHYGDSFIQQESTFWRRRLWDRAGASLDLSIEYAADFELWAHFFRFSQLFTVDAMLGGFRHQPAQKTAGLMPQYMREADSIVDREMELYRQGGYGQLLPPAKAINAYEIFERCLDAPSVHNFSYFTYSKHPHFLFFRENESELYKTRINPSDCDLKTYQDLLIYSFIKQNIPKGSRILEIGGGNSRIINVLKEEYEFWNLDKLEGLGNGPTDVSVEGFKLVRDYIGNFCKELPDNYFDFVFSISALEHIEDNEQLCVDVCNDIDRIMKEGALSLHCFDIVENRGKFWSNRLLHVVFDRFNTFNRFVPFHHISMDPHTYFMSKRGYDRFWKPATKAEFEDFGRPVSYNVLWSKAAGPTRIDTPATGAYHAAIESPPLEDSRPYTVSALVSTYNSEKHIRGRLEDLIDQTLYKKGRLQIIVVNSGSRQGEKAIVEEFQKRYEHIDYQETERETLYAAWNRGLQRARGTYLTNANADDRLHPEALEIMARTLDERSVGMVYCDALLTWGENETFARNTADRVWALPDFNLRQALMDCPFGCQFMWRKKLHEDIGTFDGSYTIAGDYEFFLRSSWKFGAYHIKEPLVLYHESWNNLSYADKPKGAGEVDRFLSRYRLTIPLEDIYGFLKERPSRESEVAALVDFANHLLSGIGRRGIREAEHFYRKAQGLVGNIPTITNNMALASHFQGRTADAVALLESIQEHTEISRSNLKEISESINPVLRLSGFSYPALDSLPPLVPEQKTRIPLRQYFGTSHPSLQASASEGKSSEAVSDSKRAESRKTSPESPIERRDGKFIYLDILPKKMDTDSLSHLAELLYRLPPSYVHVGGVGDALLLMSTFYDEQPAQSIITMPTSKSALRSLFEAFPLLKEIYILPYPKLEIMRFSIRRILSQLDNCLGMGITPRSRYYDQEWNASLNIFEQYGVIRHPKWVQGFKSQKIQDLQVVLNPKGSTVGISKSIMKVIHPQYWKALLDLLRFHHIKPIILGTPDEAIEYPSNEYCIDKRSYSFLDQMQLIASSDLLIGADTWGKTFAALSSIPIILFHSLRGEDLKDWKDHSEYVFIDPWETITLVEDMEGFSAAFNAFLQAGTSKGKSAGQEQ